MRTGDNRRNGTISLLLIMSGREDDSPVIPGLSDQILPDQQISTVTGAFDTSHKTTLRYLSTAIRSSLYQPAGTDTSERKVPRSNSHNDILRTTLHLGWPGLESVIRLSQVRSQVGARIDCLKSLERGLPPKPPRPADRAEVHIRIALMNHFNAPDPARTERVMRYQRKRKHVPATSSTTTPVSLPEPVLTTYRPTSEGISARQTLRQALQS